MADGARGRILVPLDDHRGYRTARSFESAAAHTPAHELGATRPGRVHESATAIRHNIEPRKAPHVAAKHDFAGEIAATLNEAAAGHAFDRLILVALPHYHRQSPCAIYAQEIAVKVSEVMTRRVIAVTPGTLLLDAIKLMLQDGISGLPVIDEAGKLAGMLTEGDLLRRGEIGTERLRPRWLELLLGTHWLAEDYVQAHARRVEEVMTRDVVTVDEETSLGDAVRLMERHRIKRLPVLRADQVVGIVSRADLLRTLVSLAEEIAASPSGDAEIRERLLNAFEKQSWAPLVYGNVVVRNGIVHLWGIVTNEAQRRAARVLAEATPGVKAVRDHMVWVEPLSGIAIGRPEESS